MMVDSIIGTITSTADRNIKEMNIRITHYR